MKKIFFVIALMVAAMSVNAQETFNKKDNIISLGIGYGSGLALEGKWEICVADGIADKGSVGVGAVLGWTGYSDNYTYYKYKYNNAIFGAQGNFHYEFVDRLDTYAGLTLGYEVVSGKTKWKGEHDLYMEDVKADASQFYFAAQIGTRYYFNEHWAGMLELGYGVAYAKIGFTYKF